MGDNEVTSSGAPVAISPHCGERVQVMITVRKGLSALRLCEFT